MTENGHRAELRQAFRFRAGPPQRELMTPLHRRLAQHIRQAAMIDALTRQTIDGATLHDTLRQPRVVAAREIKDRREAGAMEQVVEPLLALSALDAIVEQHDVVADGIEAGVQPAGLQRRVDATLRLRPDDRDVLLERATELRVIGDDQQARGARGSGDRL
jgi:hypothetical protein